MLDSEPPRMVKEEDGRRVVSGSAVASLWALGQSSLGSCLPQAPCTTRTGVASPLQSPHGRDRRRSSFEKFSVLLKVLSID